MDKIRIVGLSGKAESGKDFIAKNVLLPMGYKPFSLAWHLKVWLIGKGDASHEEVFNTKPPAVRKMLQLEGTEYGRDRFGQDVWCNVVEEWFNVLNENWNENRFVIPDVRFPNEVNFIHKMGGIVIRINSPERELTSKLTKEAKEHISETALDNQNHLFDSIINNDPSNTQVFNQIMDALTKYNYVI